MLRRNHKLYSRAVWSYYCVTPNLLWHKESSVFNCATLQDWLIHWLIVYCLESCSRIFHINIIYHICNKYFNECIKVVCLNIRKNFNKLFKIKITSASINCTLLPFFYKPSAKRINSNPDCNKYWTTSYLHQCFKNVINLQGNILIHRTFWETCYNSWVLFQYWLFFLLALADTVLNWLSIEQKQLTDRYYISLIILFP